MTRGDRRIAADDLNRRLGVLSTILASREAPYEDRFAAYAVLSQVRLRIHRSLAAARDDLIDYLRREDLRRLGPVWLKPGSDQVVYSCNDPENWSDLTVQDRLAELAGRRETAAYIRHVPDHFEVDPMALGADVLLGTADALILFDELNGRGWRTSRPTRTLAVDEAKAKAVPA